MKNNEDDISNINYSYVNRELELWNGIPFTVLFPLLIPLSGLAVKSINIFTVLLTIIFMIILIVFHKKGINIKSINDMIKMFGRKRFFLIDNEEYKT